MRRVGVTGTSAPTGWRKEADVGACHRHAPAGFHHRLVGAVQNSGKTIIGLNVQPFDAGKHRALPLVADAGRLWLVELWVRRWELESTGDLDRQLRARQESLAG